jgi:uncharacterized protein GlcG (DUF336 family)
MIQESCSVHTAAKSLVYSLRTLCQGTIAICGGGETILAHTGVVGSIGLGVGNSRAVDCKADSDNRNKHVSNTMMATQLWEQKLSKCSQH